MRGQEKAEETPTERAAELALEIIARVKRRSGYQDL
jgi:predicted DNA-binding WGR domain protein